MILKSLKPSMHFGPCNRVAELEINQVVGAIAAARGNHPINGLVMQGLAKLLQTLFVRCGEITNCGERLRLST